MVKISHITYVPTQKMRLESVPIYIGIVRKIIFRYRSVPFIDGLINVVIQKSKIIENQVPICCPTDADYGHTGHVSSTG